VKILASALTGLAFAAAIGTPHAAQLADKKALTLEVAKQIAAAAEAEAIKNKWTVAIAIVDDGGNLVYLEKIDETQIGSINVAIGKAKTAVSFKRPTKAMEDAIAGGRNALLSLGQTTLEGGVPILNDGKVIGAIGVSGVKSNEDAQVAKAGADALSGILGK
jgi:glc operon protein GlcG